MPRAGSCRQHHPGFGGRAPQAHSGCTRIHQVGLLVRGACFPAGCGPGLLSAPRPPVPGRGPISRPPQSSPCPEPLGGPLAPARGNTHLPKDLGKEVRPTRRSWQMSSPGTASDPLMRPRTWSRCPPGLLPHRTQSRKGRSPGGLPSLLLPTVKSHT